LGPAEQVAEALGGRRPAGMPVGVAVTPPWSGAHEVVDVGLHKCLCDMGIGEHGFLLS